MKKKVENSIIQWNSSLSSPLMEFNSQKMSTKHIISTINVILALLVRFSIQFNFSQSDTYQDLNEWSIETNLLEFNDDSNEQLLAFSEFLAFSVSISFTLNFLFSLLFFFSFIFILFPPLNFLVPIRSPKAAQPPTEHLRLCKFSIFFLFGIHHSPLPFCMCPRYNVQVQSILREK